MKLLEKYVTFDKDESGMYRVDKDCAIDSLKYGDCFVVHYAQCVEDVSKQHVEALFDNYDEAIRFAYGVKNNGADACFVYRQSKEELPPNDRHMFYFGCWNLYKHRKNLKEI